MIDLDAMHKDPWSTWPVDKMELRILVEENEKLRAANVYLCSRVDYLPYCHEIDRLRAALREIEDCDLDPRLSRQSCVEQLQSMARKALEGKDD